MNKNGRPVNILLIEDNPGDIRLTKEAFKETGMTVNLSVVTDGVEALQYLKQEDEYAQAIVPDLILLDLNLPKKDGREVLEIIKKDEKLMCIPVVVLTTSGAEQDISNSYRLHANCYLNKPIEFDKFFDLIQKVEDFWLSTTVLPTMIN